MLFIMNALYYKVVYLQMFLIINPSSHNIHEINLYLQIYRNVFSELDDLHEKYISNPLLFFCHQILMGIGFHKLM